MLYCMGQAGIDPIDTEDQMTKIARSIINVYMNAGLDRNSAISATIIDLHREAGLPIKEAYESVWGVGSYDFLEAQIQNALNQAFGE